ncbi:Post-GPI attachment to proteins factor 3 [Kappamyces sp. JEL0680]|nr:Post-GPI attachment to proteins factor 3 [Kappamyces sp. JEL0680]
MWDLTNKHIDEGSRIHQYYGKWPFYRWLGMQEPASVLFSIGNGYLHYKGASKYIARIGPRYHLRPILVLYGLVSVNTWVWSAVFHTRDFPITEKLDYFSAMLGLLVALFYGIHRIFSIKLESWISSLLALLFIGFYLWHISYLSFFRFDYGYNMKASITVAILHSIFWMGWYVRFQRSVPHAWKIAVVVLLLTTAALLEVFDFAPLWGAFDAHSLWHAATIPCVRLYWDFLLEDSRYQLALKGK